MSTEPPRSRMQLTGAWAAEIQRAEEFLLQRQNLSGALGHARAAAKLAAELGETEPLRRTAAALEALGAAAGTVSRIRKLAEHAERRQRQTQGGGEPAALMGAIGMAPETARHTVFKYLDYESGPNRLRKVRNKVLIACTSRTGSTLLCAGLERVGLDAREHFNPEGPVRDASFAGEARTIREYADILARTAVPNGWFVTKGALETFLFLCYLGEFPEHSAEWKVIYLRRRNLVRQAVSMEIAAKTQQWRANLPPTAVLEPGDYSFEPLWRHLQYIFSANAKWERVFTLLGLAPHRIFFEDLIAGVDDETVAVIGYLGYQPPKSRGESPVPPLPASQSTVLNDQWECRFRQDLASRFFGREEIS